MKIDFILNLQQIRKNVIIILQILRVNINQHTVTLESQGKRN